MSFLDKIGFGKLKEGLTKTKDDLFGKISRLVTAKKKIDDEFLNELEEIFLSSDFGYDTVAVSYTHLTLPTNREV